jgi:anti-anti-sigma factor
VIDGELPVRLAISGEMTIYRAAELKQQLIEALAPHATLELDLSKVTEFDCAGLQLLFLAHRSARAFAGDVVLVDASRAVREALELLGLNSFFDERAGTNARGRR